MSLVRTGIWLITVSVALSAIGSTVVDNVPGTHMTNPHWVPHAKFHDAAMFFFLDGIAAVALWLLWRKSREPATGSLVAVLAVVVFWTPFYYITTVYPQASLVVESPLNQPWHAGNYAEWSPKLQRETYRLFGVIPLYINVVFGTVLMVLAGIGYWLYQRGIRRGETDWRQV